ncbi:carboxypeptidase regulatory-like domain-containing protein [Acinetobacter beijerinckii]|uniref:carboxypeptidase regulatory-like domain-containing protein n=1 Tax=Acinetobacter beijerinckii TaxID=262668 RepID=UPI0030168CB3
MIVNLDVISSRDYGSEQILTFSHGLKIKGQVKETNIPIPCRVRLFERSSGRLMNEIQTDGSGNYEFSHLTANKFFITAHHPLNTYNAVIADLVVPK